MVRQALSPLTRGTRYQVTVPADFWGLCKAGGLSAPGNLRTVCPEVSLSAASCQEVSPATLLPGGVLELKRIQVRVAKLKAQTHRSSGKCADIRLTLPFDHARDVVAD